MGREIWGTPGDRPRGKATVPLQGSSHGHGQGRFPNSRHVCTFLRPAGHRAPCPLKGTGGLSILLWGYPCKCPGVCADVPASDDSGPCPSSPRPCLLSPPPCSPAHSRTSEPSARLFRRAVCTHPRREKKNLCSVQTELRDGCGLLGAYLACPGTISPHLCPI